MIRTNIWIGVFAALLCLCHSGCKAIDDATGVGDANVGQSLKQPAGTLTRKELSQRLRRLATSYLGEVPEACEIIAAANPSLEQRLLALNIRVNSADSVITIAADPDPQVALLNMVTVLTLQRMLAEERGEEFFGEQAPIYLGAAKRMEDEVWKLADQVMNDKEQAELLELIEQYRDDNPNEIYVWWVRFSSFSAYRERFSVASIGQGIVNVFVPVGSAVSGIETTTDIAERATWLATRQATIIQWRVELTYLQTLAAPETTRLLADIQRVAETIDVLPEKLAREREAILAAVEDQEAALGKLIEQSQAAVLAAKATVQEAKATVTEANSVVDNVDRTLKSAGTTIGQIESAIEKADQSIARAKAVLPETESALAQLDTTSKTLGQTIQTLDGFVKQFETEDPDPDRRPFDITEYTQAIQELGTTTEQLNALVSNLDQTAEPTRLDATLDTMAGRASALIWQAGFVLLAVGLLIVAAAKLIPRRQSA